MQLYHVGCTKPIFDTDQVTGTWAVACQCGANAPICVPDPFDDQVLPLILHFVMGEDGLSLPASFVRLLVASLKNEPSPESPPHLEYYLGFSPVQSPARRAWENYMRRSLRMISMAECREEQCQRAIEHERQRLSRAGMI